MGYISWVEDGNAVTYFTRELYVTGKKGGNIFILIRISINVGINEKMFWFVFQKLTNGEENVWHY